MAAESDCSVISTDEEESTLSKAASAEFKQRRLTLVSSFMIASTIPSSRPNSGYRRQTPVSGPMQEIVLERIQEL